VAFTSKGKETTVKFQNFIIPKVEITAEQLDKKHRIPSDQLKERILSHDGSGGFYSLYDLLEGVPSRGYKDIHRHALNYAVFDFDSSEDNKIALKECRKLFLFFMEKQSAHLSQLKLFFSGSKGFHLYAHTSLLDAPIGERCSYHTKIITQYLKEQLSLDTLDTSIHNPARKFRLPNSKHHTSGKYKVEISVKELFGSGDLKSLAESPRTLTLFDPVEIKGKVLSIQYKKSEPIIFDDTIRNMIAVPEYTAESFGSENLIPLDLLDDLLIDTPCVDEVREGRVKEGNRHQALLMLIQNDYLKCLPKSDIEGNLNKALKKLKLTHRTKDYYRALNNLFKDKKIYKQGCYTDPRRSLCQGVKCPHYLKLSPSKRKQF
jgi:hypothetical protein